jgi:hypothetical protein
LKTPDKFFSDMEKSAKPHMIHSAMANPRPLKLSNAALLQFSEKRYFGAISTKSLEKIQILALKMTIFRKYGHRAVLGWPWL